MGGEGLAERLRRAEEDMTIEGGEGAIFKDEILERVAEPLCLWRCPRPFDFALFEASFTSRAENAERFPVLSYFLEKQVELVSLRRLPEFYRWIDCMMQRFDRSIDRDAARDTT